MNIDLTLNLTDEESDCLADVVAARNAAAGTAVTAEQHLAEICMAAVLQYTADAFAASVTRLGEQARSLPYSNRKALIAAVAAQLQS